MNNNNQRYIIESITSNLKKTYYKGYYGIILSNIEKIEIQKRNNIEIDFKELIKLKSGELLKDSFRLIFHTSNSEEIVDLLIKLLIKSPTSNKLKFILDNIEDAFKTQETSFIKTIGLLGELIFIREILNFQPIHVFEVISNYQANETRGLIDFYKSGRFAIEVKTNTKHNKIHTFYNIEQINFREINYHICSVNLKIDADGQSVFDLIHEIEECIDEKTTELLRDRVYPVLMGNINKEIMFSEYKIEFYDSNLITPIHIPNEYIIDSLKIDFSEKKQISFKEMMLLLFP